jgi:hypothetical protein
MPISPLKACDILPYLLVAYVEHRWLEATHFHMYVQYEYVQNVVCIVREPLWN